MEAVYLLSFSTDPSTASFRVSAVHPVSVYYSTWNGYEEKFKRVYDFLKSFLNEQRLDEMAHAGYPLDKNVCDMLRAHRIEDEAQSNYFFDYLVQVPDANLDNLAEILSQELVNWKPTGNAEK